MCAVEEKDPQDLQVQWGSWVLGEDDDDIADNDACGKSILLYYAKSVHKCSGNSRGENGEKLGGEKPPALALKFHPDAQLLCCALCYSSFFCVFCLVCWRVFLFIFISIFSGCHAPAAAMPFLCRNTLGACGFGLHP